MKTHEISNTDDVIDSRDVIARIEELESEREDLQTALEDALESTTDEAETVIDQAKVELGEWDDANSEELKTLKALADEAEGYASDWKHGEALIRDSHFEDYARELAEETGSLDSKISSQWPYTCIDWEKAARELQYDYTSVDFGGVEYWVRS
jgi:molecular chaperone DnaK (HSP70)